MKTLNKIFTIILCAFLTGTVQAQNFDDLNFGTDSTLDVITWNIEHFPKNGQTTMDYVAEIILALDVDVVAMQEIEDVDEFYDFIDDLDGYDGFNGNHEYAKLGYIYKTSEIEVNEIYEVLTNNPRAFPRPPLVMELTYQGEDVVIYNNHFKCCGNGSMDESDEWDQETRRRDASNTLALNINFNFPNTPVIMLGDLNDILTDSPNNNVFNVYLDDPENYLFADMFIAEVNNDNWSYPSWPSHLDHILITNEIFEEDAAFDYVCDIIKLDDYMSGGLNAYDNNISDHRPVGIKLDPQSSSVGLSEISEKGVRITNYPNPFNTETTIAIHGLENSGIVEIYSLEGRKVESLKVLPTNNFISWKSNQHGAGIYFAKLIIDGEPVSMRKMVVLE